MAKFQANRYCSNTDELPTKDGFPAPRPYIKGIRRLPHLSKSSTQLNSATIIRNSLPSAEIENSLTLNSKSIEHRHGTIKTHGETRRFSNGIGSLHWQPQSSTQLNWVTLIRNSLPLTKIDKISTLKKDSIERIKKIPETKYKKNIDFNEKVAHILYIETLLFSKFFSPHSNIFELKGNSKIITKVVEIHNGRRFVRMKCLTECNLDNISEPELNFSNAFMNDIDLEYVSKNNSISEYDYRIAGRYPSSNLVHQEKPRVRDQDLVSPDLTHRSSVLNSESSLTNHQHPSRIENSILKRFTSNVMVVPNKIYQTCLVLKNEPISYIWESTSEEFKHDTEFVFNIEHSSISYLVPDEKAEIYDKSNIKECRETNFNHKIVHPKVFEPPQRFATATMSIYDEILNRKKVLDNLGRTTDLFIKELSTLDADDTDCVSILDHLEVDLEQKYLFNSYVNNSFGKNGFSSLDDSLGIQNFKLGTNNLLKPLVRPRSAFIEEKSYKSLYHLTTIEESNQEKYTETFDNHIEHLNDKIQQESISSEQIDSEDAHCKLIGLQNELEEDQELLMPSESTLLFLDNILLHLQNQYRIVGKEVHSWLLSSGTYQSDCEIENFEKNVCFTNCNHLMKCLGENTNSTIKKSNDWSRSSSAHCCNSSSNITFEKNPLLSLEGQIFIQFSELEINKLPKYVANQKSTSTEEKCYESQKHLHSIDDTEYYISLLDNLKNTFNDKISLVPKIERCDSALDFNCKLSKFRGESAENEELLILPSKSTLLLLDNILLRMQNTYQNVENEVHSWVLNSRTYHSDSKIHETSCEPETSLADENDCPTSNNCIMKFIGRNTDTTVRKYNEQGLSSSDSEAVVSHRNILSKLMFIISDKSIREFLIHNSTYDVNALRVIFRPYSVSTI